MKFYLRKWFALDVIGFFNIVFELTSAAPYLYLFGTVDIFIISTTFRKLLFYYCSWYQVCCNIREISSEELQGSAGKFSIDENEYVVRYHGVLTDNENNIWVWMIEWLMTYNHVHVRIYNANSLNGNTILRICLHSLNDQYVHARINIKSYYTALYWTTNLHAYHSCGENMPLNAYWLTIMSFHVWYVKGYLLYIGIVPICVYSCAMCVYKGTCTSYESIIGVSSIISRALHRMLKLWWWLVCM